ESPEATFVEEFGGIVDELSSALGAPVLSEPAPASMDNGPVWLYAQVESGKALSTAKLDMSAIAAVERGTNGTGVAAFALLEGDGPRVHIRCFAPSFGVPEDPVTGSANAALPAFLARAGMLDALGREYVATQGTELGRDGKVYVRVLDDTGRAEIGGHAITVVEGEIAL
ncbi:MAG: PhzF family phenazine biosynthesis protein, partial [Pirellulales bacterium]|nr:PhzF family phenazine biosynthesis protein [Pirellulales bacterium]